MPRNQSTTKTISPILLNAQQAAKMLGISSAKFYELGMQLRLPWVSVGPRDMFPVAGIEQWVKDNTQPPLN